MANENFTITQEMAVVTVERLLEIHHKAVKLDEVCHDRDVYREKWLTLKRNVLEMCLMEGNLRFDGYDNFESYNFALQNKTKLLNMGITIDEQVCFVMSRKNRLEMEEESEQE